MRICRYDGIMLGFETLLFARVRRLLYASSAAWTASLKIYVAVMGC